MDDYSFQTYLGIKGSNFHENLNALIVQGAEMLIYIGTFSSVREEFDQNRN
jgi:hypothetical protein